MPVKFPINFRFMENSLKLSKRFQDQPEKPLQRAIWWIEYILRNPNPKHLRSPTIELGFIAANSFDVISLAVISIAVFVYAVVKIFSTSRKFVFSRGKATKLKKTD